MFTLIVGHGSKLFTYYKSIIQDIAIMAAIDSQSSCPPLLKIVGKDYPGLNHIKTPDFVTTKWDTCVMLRHCTLWWWIRSSSGHSSGVEQSHLELIHIVV